LRAYCGSGLVIHSFARRQPTPSRLSASRMVSYGLRAMDSD